MSPLSPPQTNAEIRQAADLLKAGRLVAFPTETVYGLGADAENPEALARLYAVKGRPTNHPVIVHVSDPIQLSDWAVDIPAIAYRLAEAFWPGPLTLILKRSSRVPDAVTGGQDTVGIRVPDHPVALALLQAFGGGVAAPSANRFGRLSPTTAAHVQQDLGDDVDCVLDGGACQVGVESTIVAFRAGQPVILRPGMITAGQIEAVLSTVMDSPQSFSRSEQSGSTVSRAPGTLASHYAPRTPVRLKTVDEIRAHLSLPEGWKVGVLSFSGPAMAQAEAWVAMPDEPDAYARLLYGKLRELDGLDLSEIWVERVPQEGVWAAVSDRLQRAAFGN